MVRMKEAQVDRGKPRAISLRRARVPDVEIMPSEREREPGAGTLSCSLHTDRRSIESVKSAARGNPRNIPCARSHWLPRPERALTLALPSSTSCSCLSPPSSSHHGTELSAPRAYRGALVCSACYCHGTDILCRLSGSSVALRPIRTTTGNWLMFPRWKMSWSGMSRKDKWCVLQ